MSSWLSRDLKAEKKINFSLHTCTCIINHAKNTFILLLVFVKVHVMSISQEFISVCLKDLSQYQNDVSVEKLFIARSQSRYRCYDSAQKRNKPADVIQRKPSLFFPSLRSLVLFSVIRYPLQMVISWAFSSERAQTRKQSFF